MNFGTFYNILAETNLKKFGYKMTLHVFYLLFLFLMMVVVVILYSRTTLPVFWCLTLIYLEEQNNFSNAPPRNLTLFIWNIEILCNNSFDFCLSTYFQKQSDSLKFLRPGSEMQICTIRLRWYLWNIKKKNSHEKEVHTYFYWRKKNKLLCPHCSFHWICWRLKTNY